MGKILVEKLSYTEVNKNISQTEYEKIQEEYLLSRSPEKYMISMPVRVLMFEGLEREPNIRYYIYEEDHTNFFFIQNQTSGHVVHKTKFSLTQEEVEKILSGDYQFLLDSEEPAMNSLYFQFTINMLHPTYKKECTRKIFHQNRFLDIVIDISIKRTPFEGSDFFTPQKLYAQKKSSLRCHTRQYLTLSKPVSSLLKFNEQLLHNQTGNVNAGR